MRKTSKGFTLIELLTVIFIIGILSTLMIANFSKSRVKARDAKRKEDLAQISRALETYFQDNQYYPPSWSGSGDNYLASTVLTPLVSSSTTMYMSTLPKDPSADKAMPSGDCIDSTYCNGSGDKKNYLYASPSDSASSKPQYYALFTYLEDTPSASDSSTVLETSSYCGVASGIVIPLSGTFDESCRAAYAITAKYSVRTLP